MELIDHWSQFAIQSVYVILRQGRYLISISDGIWDTRMTNNESDRSRLPPSTALGFFLAVLPLLLFLGLVGIWPFTDKTSQTLTSAWLSTLKPDQILLVIVLLSGAIGSSLHAARSFSAYVGLESYAESWTWWYLMRVPVGMGLALVIYLVLRGGLVSGNFADQSATINTLNPFGIAGLSALAGLFAKNATAKLEEVFETMFRTNEDTKPATRAKQAVVLNVPELNQNMDAAESDLRVTIKGENFDRKTEALVDNVRRAMEFKNSRELILILEPEDVQQARTLSLIIRNSGAVDTKAELKVK
jgi:hypothetical protein